jgi:hypothetical protein
MFNASTTTPRSRHLTSLYLTSPYLSPFRLISHRLSLSLHPCATSAGRSRPSHLMKSTPRTPNKLPFLRSRHLIAEAYSLAGSPGRYNRDACAGIGSSPIPSVASVYRSKATLMTGAVGPQPVRVDSRPCPPLPARLVREDWAPPPVGFPPDAEVEMTMDDALHRAHAPAGPWHGEAGWIPDV